MRVLFFALRFILTFFLKNQFHYEKHLAREREYKSLIRDNLPDTNLPILHSWWYQRHYQPPLRNQTGSIYPGSNSEKDKTHKRFTSEHRPRLTRAALDNQWLTNLWHSVLDLIDIKKLILAQGGKTENPEKKPSKQRGPTNSLSLFKVMILGGKYIYIYRVVEEGMNTRTRTFGLKAKSFRMHSSKNTDVKPILKPSNTLVYSLGSLKYWWKNNKIL